jgi:SNF2 family DNA or RNA helicase
MEWQPHPYQTHTLDWLCQRTVFSDEESGALLLDPGLGKTAIVLAWISMLKALKLPSRVLVVAPLRVVYSVWPQEIAKWDQFNGLTTAIVHGSPAKRVKAVGAKADLHLINPEGLVWLESHCNKHGYPFDVLVIDESSKFKSWSAKRTKALRRMLDVFERRVIMTGTPSPNSVADLFSQMFLLDKGKALGTGITKFRNRYFYRGGYQGYQWLPHQGAAAAIEKKIQHLCIRMSAEDHLDLPEMLINDVLVDLPASVRPEYKRLETQMFAQMDAHGGLLTPANAGARYMACRQIANGGVYWDEGVKHLHTAKIDAALDIVDELQGKPALIAFQFKHDLVRLRRAWPKLPSIDGGTSVRDTERLIQLWNQGELPVLAVQPQALSHGVNMQAGPGRDIIWLGLTDNLENYDQLNKRVHRQGVTGKVRIHRILARATVDQAIRLRLRDKDHNQSALLNALNQYRKDSPNGSVHHSIV